MEVARIAGTKSSDPAKRYFTNRPDIFELGEQVGKSKSRGMSEDCLVSIAELLPEEGLIKRTRAALMIRWFNRSIDSCRMMPGRAIKETTSDRGICPRP